MHVHWHRQHNFFNDGCFSRSSTTRTTISLRSRWRGRMTWRRRHSDQSHTTCAASTRTRHDTPAPVSLPRVPGSCGAQAPAHPHKSQPSSRNSSTKLDRAHSVQVSACGRTQTSLLQKSAHGTQRYQSTQAGRECSVSAHRQHVCLPCAGIGATRSDDAFGA